MPRKKKLTADERRGLLDHNTRFLRKLFKKRQYIIGLDLGTHITGFSYSNSKDEKRSTTMKMVGEGNLQKRIQKISETFEHVIEKSVEKRNTIAILEDYAYRGTSVVQIAELGGILKLSLYKHGIPYFTLAPQTLKKSVLGPSKKGTGTMKQNMMVEVLDRWGKKFTDDNECDAFCLAMFLFGVKDFVFGEERMKKWAELMFKDFITNRGMPVL